MPARTIIEAEPVTLSTALRARTNVLSAAGRLTKELRDELAHLPPSETRRRVEAALRELDQLGVTPDEREGFVQSTGHRAKAPAAPAKRPTRAQLVAAITRSTGLANWTAYEPEDDEYDVDSVADVLDTEYQLKVDPKQIDVINFTRSTDNRSELYFVQVALTPAGIYLCDAATDRASGFSDFVKDLAGLENFLSTT